MALQHKSIISEGTTQATPHDKERLFEAEKALRSTARKLEDLQGEYSHLTSQLQDLALPEDASSHEQNRNGNESAGHLLSRIKSQLMDSWREIERLQQVLVFQAVYDRVAVCDCIFLGRQSSTRIVSLELF